MESISGRLDTMAREVRDALVAREVGPSILCNEAGRPVSHASVCDFRDGKIKRLNPEAIEALNAALLRIRAKREGGEATGADDGRESAPTTEAPPTSHPTAGRRRGTSVQPAAAEGAHNPTSAAVGGGVAKRAVTRQRKGVAA